MKKLKIQQVRSEVGRKYDQRETLIALGITRMGQVVTHNDTPQIRGMIKKVNHLVSVSEFNE
jgi:large subunit ribosomal protein L30